ncbi:MAG: ferritin family protein [Candidatus Hatepunaea meridiana]|nr:ferritin family protein [Candidatus Hatepunaea meridiana]
MNFEIVEEVIDFAIKREEEAYDFYIDLAAKMDRPSMSAVFEDFAREELGHKAKLIAIKESEFDAPFLKETVDLKIGDYLVDVEPSPGMDFQQALIVAMKQEKAAYKLYTDLAAEVTYENLRDTLLLLAQEEAKHKLRFEIEYDEIIKDN